MLPRSGQRWMLPNAPNPNRPTVNNRSPYCERWRQPADHDSDRKDPPHCIQMKFTLTAEVSGDAWDDLEIALEELLRLVSEGNTSGFGQNESGSFEFTIN